MNTTAPTVVPSRSGQTSSPPGDLKDLDLVTGVRKKLRDLLVMTRRNLVHVRREPEQLADVTFQPVLFTLLFVYVFGAGVVLPDGGDYKDYALAGMLVFNLAPGVIGTAVGLSTDLSTGVIERFRTLPVWRPAVLAGRSIVDLLSLALGALIVALTGLAIGWRPSTDAGSVIAGFALVLLFVYALTWAAACLGLTVKGPETAQSLGLMFIFPATIVSNALVPTERMPAVLRAIADWNPISAVVSACRELFGNPNPSATIDAWPMQHPVWATLAWSLAILAVCGPLATRLYRRHTTA